MLQQLTGQIMDDSFLTEKQQEERIIQVFDLCYFINRYKRSLKIINCSQHKINIVDDNGIKKGIYFCDLIYNSRYFLDESLFNSFNLNSFKNQSNVEELWFVVVEEGLHSNLKESNEFIEKNNVNHLYDRIFYFNFSQSKIKHLK